MRWVESVLSCHVPDIFFRCHSFSFTCLCGIPAPAVSPLRQGGYPDSVRSRLWHSRSGRSRHCDTRYPRASLPFARAWHSRHGSFAIATAPMSSRCLTATYGTVCERCRYGVRGVVWATGAEAPETYPSAVRFGANAPGRGSPRAVFRCCHSLPLLVSEVPCYGVVLVPCVLGALPYIVGTGTVIVIKACGKLVVEAVKL